ncbi:crossover junction endodeoxyribonuclease RuvC [Nibricoccus aquaticus]|uniref:Crossover junction endodeoxyribonuclease RuvC n=1 Tax=Nibricoccus aquaticus TaxID=2576891 RepID=A0A290QDD1_9BACT|nr:crossover junction endodeoxyribonuclease RuvC [Nibricoccus aquaticus]ATC65230.1 crossover junction endodeoxyribonuclease RuvC [Nibricoccus aquaticus]
MPRQNVRQLWAAKLSGKITAASTATLTATASLKHLTLKATASLSLTRAPFSGRVLGIDPSLRGTGLALIEFTPGRQPILLRCLTVKVPAREPMSVALAEIHRAVTAFVVGQDIRHVALEQTIFVQNFQTAQILGAARGAAIAAAALHEKPIFEYAPLRVKQAVVGAGRASKEQMARTVMSMLGHGRPLAFDEADAAGVALCHAFTWRE